MLRVEIHQKDSMSVLGRRLKLWKNKNDNEAFDGFHYFAPLHLGWNPRDGKYPPDVFVCCFAAHELIGVLLLQKSNEPGDVWWVSYVDVKLSWRKKGAASSLYNGLNHWVSPDTVIYGSSLSDDGKAADLYGLRARTSRNWLNFNTAQDYFDFLHN